MRTILTVVFLALSWAMPAAAQEIDKLPTITAVGTVEVEAVPDEVNFWLKVAKIDKDLQTAASE